MVQIAYFQLKSVIFLPKTWAVKTPTPIRYHFSLYQIAKKCYFFKNFEFFAKILKFLSFLRFSSRIRFDKWMPKLHKSWTINFWKWRDAERWRKVNYSVVMVDTKPPLVHQGAIQFMEIRNLKFHKIHKKSKTLVKTVFNGLIFERSDMVKTTVARTLSVDLD